MTSVVLYPAALVTIALFLWVLFAIFRVPRLRLRRNAVDRLEAWDVARLERAARALQLELPDMFMRAWRSPLAILSRPRKTQTYGLDVEATALETARTMRFRPVRVRGRVPSRFLVMVDAQRPRDHLAALARRLVDAMRAARLDVVLLEFKGDPRVLWSNEVRPGLPTSRSWKLSEAAATHSLCTLLLISTADRIVEGSPAGLRALPDFEAWESRVLLTPRSEADFGRVERSFGDAGFSVLSLGPNWIRRLAMSLDDGLPETRHRPAPIGGSVIEALGESRLLDDLPLSQRETDALLEELKMRLGDAAFTWLCACAIYPLLVPRLTELLGSILTDAGGNLVGSDHGFVAMSALPWFREGRMPDWMRRALVPLLSESAKVDARSAYVRLFSAG